MVALDAHDASSRDAQIGAAEVAHADQVRGDERVLQRDEHVQRRLRVRRDCKVSADITLKILVIRMHQQIVRRDADDFHARLDLRRVRAFELIAHGVELAEQIDRLE